MITEQEFFDKTVRHLLTQNARSAVTTTAGDLCVYRSLDGLRCAVGAHIPDELYCVEREERIVSVLLKEYPSLQAYIPSESLASALQALHDFDDPRLWASELRIIARDRGMDASVVGAVLKELGRTE